MVNSMFIFFSKSVVSKIITRYSSITNQNSLILVVVKSIAIFLVEIIIFKTRQLKIEIRTSIMS